MATCPPNDERSKSKSNNGRQLVRRGGNFPRWCPPVRVCRRRPSEADRYAPLLRNGCLVYPWSQLKIHKLARRSARTITFPFASTLSDDA